MFYGEREDDCKYVREFNSTFARESMLRNSSYVYVSKFHDTSELFNTEKDYEDVFRCSDYEKDVKIRD